jgi:hypothetical protein
MATVIRATCNDCGDIEIGTCDLVVRLCEDTDAGTYVFRCPRCSTPVVRSADRPTIDLLVSSGVRLELWTLPAELIEARPVAPPLSHDDLLDFHELLGQKNWFEELLAAHRRFR